MSRLRRDAPTQPQAFCPIPPPISSIVFCQHIEYIRYREFIQLIILQSLARVHPLSLGNSPSASLGENTVFFGSKYTLSRIYFFFRFFHFSIEIIALWERLSKVHGKDPEK